ncbi:PepSY domain-containing protein [Rossellomorea vietnamensis]|uniref:Peptidase n=1 Tax=Rossellomorea aquimaris TaxID=189382 RepID=A0A5D4THZ3_9BACI|nr:PepSY domain-containing protein [Rossellomorea aquimaris]TYS75463.1 peptidase [Rossellomorea aquimaris]
MNINKKYMIISGVTLGLLGGGLLAAESDMVEDVFAADQSKLMEKADIKEAEASEIALAEVPGEITETEIEEDDGKIIYEFEIETDSGEKEVEVDGMSGEVLEVEKEDGDVENETEENDSSEE